MRLLHEHIDRQVSGGPQDATGQKYSRSNFSSSERLGAIESPIAALGGAMRSFGLLKNVVDDAPRVAGD